MALTKEQRDALPDSDFAVPEKRALPIHDQTHVRMAWNMVDRTKGLSTEERSQARRRILRRAKELGIDTSDWEKSGMQAMRFEAMALDVPEVPDHPNRVPFSGVLTRVDQPSDNPVGGAKGRRVYIPKDVAEKALGSLLGMGVDYASDMAGHDPQKKIGVITAATINEDDDAIHVEGFLYGADFPAVVKDIQSRKSLLGFSYEAQASVADWNQDPVEVTSCVFTGAAILLKDRAAYTTTSLEASASSELTEMDVKELMAAVAKLTEQNTELMNQVKELKAGSEKLQAASVLHKVKPHSDKLREVADAMEKDGVGLHEKRGHVSHLRRMADKMDAEAMMGKLPHIYGDETWMDASADASSKQIADLQAEIAKLKEQLFAQAEKPDRKTEPAKSDKSPLEAGKIDYRKLDAELKARGLPIQKRLEAITAARMNLQ